MIGVIYKWQESKHTPKFKIGKPMHRGKEHLLTLLGYYWHMLMAADFYFRQRTIDVAQDRVMGVINENKWVEEFSIIFDILIYRLRYALALNITSYDVPWVWSSEIERNRTSLSNYIPDHIITIDHKRRLIRKYIMQKMYLTFQLCCSHYPWDKSIPSSKAFRCHHGSFSYHKTIPWRRGPFWHDFWCKVVECHA